MSSWFRYLECFGGLPNIQGDYEESYSVWISVFWGDYQEFKHYWGITAKSYLACFGGITKNSSITGGLPLKAI